MQHICDYDHEHDHEECEEEDNDVLEPLEPDYYERTTDEIWNFIYASSFGIMFGFCMLMVM